MISITGTGEPPVPLKKGWVDTLRLQFDDIERPTPGLELFSEEDADKVIGFLKKVDGRADHVVVHCTFAQSRSPGVARAISVICGLTNAFMVNQTYNKTVYNTIIRRWEHRFASDANLGRTAPEKDSGGAEKDSSKEFGATYRGPLPRNHWIYSTGPVVNGRPLFPPPTKKKEG